MGANQELRARLARETKSRGGSVYFPELAYCTDNGAMIALVGALRLPKAAAGDYGFSIKPRWDLSSLEAP